MPNITGIDLWLNVTNYLKLTPTTSVLALLVAICIYQSCRRLRTPRLQGPPSQSIGFGITKKVFPSSDVGFVYQDWERTYGPVYEIPASFGSRHVVLSDPKAIAHFFSKDTTTYHQPAVQRAGGRRLVSVCPPAFFRVFSHISFQFGDILVAVEGETHKRFGHSFCSVT